MSETFALNSHGVAIIVFQHGRCATNRMHEYDILMGLYRGDIMV